MLSKKLNSTDPAEEVPVKAYTKAELARLYNVSPKIFHTWLTHWQKDLKRFKYVHRQKMLTAAQVNFLFRDDVLGKP